MIVKKTNLKRVNKMSEEQQLAEAKKLFPAVIDEVGKRVRTAEEVKPFTVGELHKSLGGMKNR